MQAAQQVSVHQVLAPPGSHISVLYAGADLVDAYATPLAAASLRDIRAIATQMFAGTPSWIKVLMRLRNAIVAPLGLKSSSQLERLAKAGGPDRVGFMRVYATSASEIVLGEDDAHLNFRLSILLVPVTPIVSQQFDIVATTVVCCNNRLGKMYLFVIKPFHRLVVIGMLKALSRNLQPVMA